MSHDTAYVANMSEQQQKLNQNILESAAKLSSVSNMTSSLINLNSNTNLLLGKILKVLSQKHTTTPRTVKSTIDTINDNATSDNLIPYINKIKEALEETIAAEKQNVIMDLDDKIEKINSKIDLVTLTTNMPVHDKLINVNETTQKTPMFTEICVGLILVILVAFILVKLYQSKISLSSNRSYNCSTRHIADAMENSNL